ncbi:MAG: hypothetical protein ABSC64_11510 [Candidatus Korobacteraceae bacterium]|jgi:hypothetical protein
MLKQGTIFDGNGKIVGSKIIGFQNDDVTVVHDEHRRITGSSSEKFGTTRDEKGRIVSCGNHPDQPFPRKHL